MENLAVRDYMEVNKGRITLGPKVMVSDPCYGLDTWCQGVLDNVLPGEYNCFVEFYNEGYWGTRVSSIRIEHVDWDLSNGYSIEPFEVGVDSGTAGIFDYEYYKKYHVDENGSKCLNKDWYYKTGDLTYGHKENPNYVPFEWNLNINRGDVESLKAEIRRHIEWEDNFQISQRTIGYFDGNTVDSLGLVSSSGYGDGGYTCYTAKNDEGKIVSIMVVFISDEYDD